MEGSHPRLPHRELTQSKARTLTSPLTCSIHLGEPPTGSRCWEKGEEEEGGSRREKGEKSEARVTVGNTRWALPRGCIYLPTAGEQAQAEDPGSVPQSLGSALQQRRPQALPLLRSVLLGKAGSRW